MGYRIWGKFREGEGEGKERLQITGCRLQGCPISDLPDPIYFFLLRKKRTASFLKNGGLILDGGEGLLDVAGAGGAAGHGVHDAEGPDGFFCDPAGKAARGRYMEAGSTL